MKGVRSIYLFIFDIMLRDKLLDEHESTMLQTGALTTFLAYPYVINAEILFA